MKKILDSVERPFLKAITGAYGTTSTQAMSTIAGCAPLRIRANTSYEMRKTGWTKEKADVGNRIDPCTTGSNNERVDEIGEENGRRVEIYVDASIKERKGGIGILIKSEDGEEQEMEKYEGELDIAELEEIAVLKGIRIAAIKCEEEPGTKVIINTDRMDILKKIAGIRGTQE